MDDDDDGSIDPYQQATALNSHQVKGETSRMRQGEAAAGLVRNANGISP